MSEELAPDSFQLSHVASRSEITYNAYMAKMYIYSASIVAKSFVELRALRDFAQNHTVDRFYHKERVHQFLG